MDDVPPEQICHRTEKKYTPHVLHFCQRYSIGDFFISKYMYPDLIQCDTPLIRLPEQDSAVRYNYSHYGDGTTDNWPEKKSHLKYKNAFMVSTSSLHLCNLTASSVFISNRLHSDGHFPFVSFSFQVCKLLPEINDAAKYYKKNHCSERANFNETWEYFSWKKEEEKKKNNKR